MKISLNNSPEKQQKIKEALPARPLIDTILHPHLDSLMSTVLLDILKKEIEVYKVYPKNNGKYDPEKFNPRNHKTCFMGMGFFANGQGGMEDSDLPVYRQGVGTLHHPTWGDHVTLLEIWGGDHFEKFPDMVKAVYDYAFGYRDTMPEVVFLVNPLVFSKDSGTFLMDEEDLAERRFMQLAAENQLRHNYGLKTQDYLADEIEVFRKEGKWNEKRQCLKEDKPEGRRRYDLEEDEEDDE